VRLLAAGAARAEAGDLAGVAADGTAGHRAGPGGRLRRHRDRPGLPAGRIAQGWLAAAALLCGLGVLALPAVSWPPPAIAGAGMVTDAASVACVSPVTPGTFFRFVTWAGPLDLSPAGRLTITAAVPGGAAAGDAYGGLLFPGHGGRPGSPPGVIMALPYPGSGFSLPGTVGQAVIVAFPPASLEFPVVPAGHRSFARFVVTGIIVSVKAGDRISKSAAGDDRDARGIRPSRRDPGEKFSSTPAGPLIIRRAAVVLAGVPRAQCAALTRPRPAGRPAP
jgi:hypothetical protein